MADIKKEPQKRRLSDESIMLFKSVFAENFELVIAMRKVLLGLELTTFDSSLISSQLSNSEELYKIISDMFSPKLKGDEPLHQITDLWLPLNVKEATTEAVLLQIKSRKILIKYIEERVNLLFGKTKEETIKLSDLLDFDDIDNKDAFEIHVNIHARNNIIQHIEAQLATLYLLAGLKGETIEQTTKRLQQNSSK